MLVEIDLENQDVPVIEHDNTSVEIIPDASEDTHETENMTVDISSLLEPLNVVPEVDSGQDEYEAEQLPVLTKEEEKEKSKHNCDEPFEPQSFEIVSPFPLAPIKV